MNNQTKRQLPPHWSGGWPHCAFTPQEPIVFGQGETILLAEKEPNLLKLGKSLLENLKYRVLIAGSGTDILEQCQKEQISMMIFDVEIDPPFAEVENILSAARKLQPTMKVLLSTAHDISLGLGCCPPVQDLPVLAKPFTVRSFSQAINQCLTTTNQ
ncbi:MAG: response regulator [Pelovirga sp.]